MATAQFSALRSTFKERNYTIYIAGNSVSLVGNWIQRTTVAWLAWEMTHQATWLGIVSFADLAPAVLIAPFAGVAADRFDRRLMLLAAQIGMTVLSFAMFIFAAMGWMTIGWLVTLVLMHGMLVGVSQPARLALVPSLVERANLPTAIGINSAIFHGSRFVGPAIAGGLIVGSGVAAAFLVNMVTYVTLIVSLLLLRGRDEPRSKSGHSVIEQLLEGWRYIIGHPMVCVVFLLLLGGAVTVRPIGELLPGLADAVHGRGATGFALMSAMMGIGAFTGAIQMALFPVKDQIRTMLLSQAGLVFAVAAVALMPNFILTVLMLALTGYLLILTGVSVHTFVQLETPAELRGRVMSSFGLAFRSAPAVGALLLGAIADLAGLRFALMLGVFVFSALLLWQWRRLKIDRAVTSP